jgi:hypothetical protein
VSDQLGVEQPPVPEDPDWWLGPDWPPEPPDPDGWEWDLGCGAGDGAAGDGARWPAGLPADVRAAAGAGPWTGEGEALAAGFLHHVPGPPGTGFAAGGVLDRLAPGPWLAEALAAVTGYPADPAAVYPAAGGCDAAPGNAAGAAGGRADAAGQDAAGQDSAGQDSAGGYDAAGGNVAAAGGQDADGGDAAWAGASGAGDAGPAGAGPAGAGAGVGGHDWLGESELIGVLCGWRRVASWAAAGQAAAVIALARRRAAQAAARHNQHLADHVADELACALTLTGRAAALLLDDAAGLVRLPEVHQSLAAGQIDGPKAGVFTAELAALPAAAAREIAGRVLPGAPTMTTGQLRYQLRRLVLAHDPDAAGRRRDEAARGAEVQAWAESSGNAGLAGRELPEADVITADRRLTAQARWLKANGATGTIAQLRAAAFTAVLNGRDITTLLPATPPAGPPPAGTAGPPPAGTAGPPPAGAAGAAGAGGGVAGWPAITGSFHLTMPLSAWAGTSEAPGEIAGHGRCPPAPVATWPASSPPAPPPAGASP